MRQLWLAGAAFLLVAGSSPAAANGQHGTASAWAVGYRTPAALHGLQLARLVPALRVAEVRGDVAGLASRPGIRYVQRALVRRSDAEPALLPALHGLPAEWQYTAVHADAVPDAVLRAAAQITIAVIDTGADLSAPDLAAKAPSAYNVHTGTTSVRDANGHGTFVASLAAGSVTNGEGIAGFGGDAKLLIVKAGNGGGSFSDVDEASAIVWAVDHGARILNLSLGGPRTSLTERNAITYAATHGALLVAAVGNELGQGNPVEYPAALLQPVGSDGQGGFGLAVAASTETGAHASFSNTGSYVSLAAPGNNVFGAVSSFASPRFYPRVSLPGSLAGSYGYASGTSFAAPEVAGAAALVWAANPLLTAQQVADILKQTASGRGSWSPELGFGVIEVAAAVAQASGRPSVIVSGARDPLGLRLTWSAHGAVAAFQVSVSRDGGPAEILIASTTQTSGAFALEPGHAYAFTVGGLDATGAATGSPASYLIKLKRLPSAR